MTACLECANVMSLIRMFRAVMLPNLRPGQPVIGFYAYSRVEVQYRKQARCREYISLEWVGVAEI